MVATYSADGGLTWEPEFILRDDFKSINGFKDLGIRGFSSDPMESW